MYDLISNNISNLLGSLNFQKLKIFNSHYCCPAFPWFLLVFISFNVHETQKANVYALSHNLNYEYIVQTFESTSRKTSIIVLSKMVTEETETQTKLEKSYKKGYGNLVFDYAIPGVSASGKQTLNCHLWLAEQEAMMLGRCSVSAGRLPCCELVSSSY